MSGPSLICRSGQHLLSSAFLYLGLPSFHSPAFVRKRQQHTLCSSVVSKPESRWLSLTKKRIRVAMHFNSKAHAAAAALSQRASWMLQVNDRSQKRLQNPAPMEHSPRQSAPPQSIKLALLRTTVTLFLIPLA